MSERIIDVFENIHNGGEAPEDILVNFEMVKSQSCGCVKKKANDSTVMMRELHDRLDGYQQRVSDMNDIVSYISSVRKPELIYECLEGKEMFNDTFCCLNMSALDFKMKNGSADADIDTEHPFTDEMLMVYRGLFHYHYDSSTEIVHFDRKDIVPEFDKYIDMENPVIFSALHYLNIPLGYICANMEVNIVVYERIQQISETFGNGFGNIRMYTAMERLYICDSLTGLYNRRGFYQYAVPQFEKAAAEKKTVAIVSADLDGLKYINDHFGHAEGDNAIKTVTCALLHAAENNEVCARFGGDEFVVAGVTELSEEEYSENFRKRFDEYLENYNNEAGKPYKVEASIGITCRQPENFNVDDMIKLSDDLMYTEKSTRKHFVRSRPRND